MNQEKERTVKYFGNKEKVLNKLKNVICEKEIESEKCSGVDLSFSFFPDHYL